MKNKHKSARSEIRKLTLLEFLIYILVIVMLIALVNGLRTDGSLIKVLLEFVSIK